MGKFKESRTNNVKKNIFKVAGCKSLKAKNKAKAVTLERTKSIHLKNRQKVEDVDKQLSMLQAEVRQCPPSKGETEISRDAAQSVRSQKTVKKQEEIRRYAEAEKNCEEALGKLLAMDMQ